MAATLTLCASRKMLSSVCLLPIRLAFHCSMLNVLSDIEGVWAGLGGGEGARGCGGVIHAVQIQPLVYDNPQRFEYQNILNVPNANIVYTGSWYLDVFEADRAGVP